MGDLKSWQSFRAFARRVVSERRFILAADDREFLDQLLATAKHRIRTTAADTGLWRAQLGHAWRSEHTEDGEYIGDMPDAYLPKRMKPLKGRAREGRANPKGIRCLYLSNRKETAMSEVRPWVGSYVSLGHFKTARELRIVDCSVHHDNGFDIFFEEPLPEQRSAAVWAHVDQAFSEPVTEQDDFADYVPTQIIAESFKSEGYDGVAYKSMFGENGYNIALFNPADAELTTCILHRAESAKWEFEQADNPYWVEPDGAIKTLTMKIPPGSDSDESASEESSAESATSPE